MSLLAYWPAASVPALVGALNQSALAPAANNASRIHSLWWLYLIVLSIVWALVVAALLLGVWRARDVPPLEKTVPIVPPPSGTERWLTASVITALSATVAILLLLLFIDFFTSRAIAKPAPPGALQIKLTGHQWWWEVRYEDPTPSKILTTANEIHIPLGQPVKFELNSVDVIHSFWIPNLSGKRDLIPGHPTNTWFVPTQAGTYYGQCAEFCGEQHAHMRLAVTVDPPEQFAQWLEAQRQPPPPPSKPREQRGQQIFLGTTCVMCHTIQGTPARATVGPDLTHLASRQWLGAGALPNVRGYLGGWILDPPAHKPGVRMPQHTFGGEDLTALLDYLQTLK
jgi:cytochrome c oxidase subunit 2